MPAIQLSQFNAELDELVLLFDQPGAFHTFLQRLFERYANFSFRQSENLATRISVPQYHIAPIILQKIEQAVRSRCITAPEAGFKLAAALWSDTFYEPRYLAAIVLGLLPSNPPERILETILAWATPDEDIQVLKILLDKGCFSLRNQHPKDWQQLMEGWLEADELGIRLLGFQALLVSVQDPSFPNLPAVFKLISNPILQPPKTLQPILQDLLSALIRRAPSETSMFINQICTRRPPAVTVRMIRRRLNAFPAAYQQNLRAVLQNAIEVDENL